MYYVWQQRYFSCIMTTEGQAIDVLHPGLRNNGSGPDFFNAKIKQNGIVWAGSVEMHVRASDWHRHHHDDDPAYDGVILHVVLQHDADIRRHDGSLLPTALMQIPDALVERYRMICGDAPSSAEGNIPRLAGSNIPLLPGEIPSYTALSCAPLLSEVPDVILHDWLTSLCIERMLQKMERVRDLVEAQLCAWPEAFYVILTRSLGTGVNGDAMERLARSLPYNCLLHHRDHLEQLQALLLGQAGFLQQEADHRPAADREAWHLLQREYTFLRQKFSLTPLPVSMWHLGRIRPPAQPEARLRALALLLHRHADLFGVLLEAKDLRQLLRLLRVEGLGQQTLRSLVINAVVPTLLSYAQWQNDDERLDHILRILEELPAEDNHYLALWRHAGIIPRHALDSQALLQLIQHYCQPHQCLQCRIGCRLLSAGSRH